MKEKKTHGVQLLLQAVVRDPDGKIISDTGQRPAKSFVIQFLEFIGGMMKPGVSIKATDRTGAENYICGGGECTNHLQAAALVGEYLYGVAVGTGDTAETNTDYSLEAQIIHGASAGQLTYGAVVFVAAGVVGANVDLVIKRVFTNNSGAAIVVKEVGIFTKWFASPNTYYHLIVRDVLGLTNVPDMCSLTIIYTMRTTV